MPVIPALVEDRQEFEVMLRDRGFSETSDMSGQGHCSSD